MTGIGIGRLSVEDQIRELEARITALEESGAGLGKKIVFGKATLKWPVKEKESAALVVVTGLSVVSAVVGLATSARVTVGVPVIAGGLVTFRGFDSTEEIAAGGEVNMFWIAIGE